LAEISNYDSEHEEIKFDKIPFDEYISNENGETKESATLDNKGGWYYNKDTGEVKLNLTKPLKSYLPFYFGPYRNEVPSEW
jgi:hypothetical protein